MTEVRSAQLKNEILSVLYQRIVNDSPRYITVPYIRECTKLGVTNQFVETVLEGLEIAGLVSRGGSRPGERGKFAISDQGLDYVQAGRKFSVSDLSIIDDWREPDRGEMPATTTLDAMRYHLSQCVTLISSSQLSQHDRAQVIGLIRVCEQMIDLPTPKLGLVKKVLGWLKDIKDIAPLVETILKFLG